MANRNAPSTFPLSSVLEQNKLDGTNFNDWFRNLKIVLKQQKKEYVLQAPLGDAPVDNAPRATKVEYQRRVNDSNEVSCLMVISLTPELQRRLEDWAAFEMIEELRNMYQEPARVEKHCVALQLYGCKMAEGASVRTHVQKMMGLLEQLEKLGYNIELEQATDLILFSLPPSFSMFVMNYNTAGELKQLNELYSMLATAETTFKKAPEVLSMSKENRKIGKKTK